MEKGHIRAELREKEEEGTRTAPSWILAGLQSQIRFLAGEFNRGVTRRLSPVHFAALTVISSTVTISQSVPALEWRKKTLKPQIEHSNNSFRRASKKIKEF